MSAYTLYRCSPFHAVILGIFSPLMPSSYEFEDAILLAIKSVSAKATPIEGDVSILTSTNPHFIDLFILTPSVSLGRSFVRYYFSFL